MTICIVWAWIERETKDGSPVIARVPHFASDVPPHKSAWKAEQDAEAWWEEIQATGKGRRWLKYLADLIGDGRVPVWEVTPRQLRLALNQLGFRSMVEEAIAASEDLDLKDMWEYSLSYDRWHPLVIAFTQQLNIPPEQVDALWALAETL